MASNIVAILIIFLFLLFNGYKDRSFRTKAQINQKKKETKKEILSQQTCLEAKTKRTNGCYDDADTNHILLLRATSTGIPTDFTSFQRKAPVIPSPKKEIRSNVNPPTAVQVP